MSSASGLRQRRRGNDDLDSGPAKKPVITLESFDLYQKVRTEEKTSTTHGGTVSLIALVVCFLLIAAELYSYLVPQQREHMAVDPVVEGRLRINFDLTFHALPCGEASLDAMDVAGEQQNGLGSEPGSSSVIKTRLDPQGKPIGTAFSLELEQTRKQQAALAKAKETQPSPLPAGYCGSCYGADAHPNQCCNSCDEVRRAYADKGWDVASVTTTAEQCQREHRDAHPASHELSKPGEGCRLTGFLLVNKVAGNFHVALGETSSRGHGHVHQFNPASISKFNVTHTIHSLSFGDPLPGSKHAKNPLDGTFKGVPTEGSGAGGGGMMGVNGGTGTGVWMYYLKVIPTLFDSKGTVSNEFNLQAGQTAAGNSGSSASSATSASAAIAKHAATDSEAKGVIKTNQYSVTSQFRPAFLLGQRMNVIPGVFFVYEISPFMVTITRHSTSFSQLLTSLFAILGGVLTLAKIIDAAITMLVNFLGGPKNVSEIVQLMVVRATTGNKNAVSASGKTMAQLLAQIGGGASGGGGLSGFGSAALAAFSNATSGGAAIKPTPQPQPQPLAHHQAPSMGMGMGMGGAAAMTSSSSYSHQQQPQALYSGTAAPQAAPQAAAVAATGGWAQPQQPQQPQFAASSSSSAPLYSGTAAAPVGAGGGVGGVHHRLSGSHQD